MEPQRGDEGDASDFEGVVDVVGGCVFLGSHCSTGCFYVPTDVGFPENGWNKEIRSCE